MQKLNAMLFVLLFTMLSACGDNNESNSDKAIKENTGMTSGEIEQQSAAAGTFKKYPMKSGAVTFQRSGIIGNAEIIVYFDDYGKKERNEVYGEDGLITEITMSDGVNMYKLTEESLAQKTAYIMGPGLHGTEMQFVTDPYNEKRKIKYDFKKLTNIEVVGKDCEAYSVKSGGGTTTFAGWQGLLLYSKVEMSMGVMETVAVDINENAEVDPGLFKVPDGYKIEKM